MSGPGSLVCSTIRSVPVSKFRSITELGTTFIKLGQILSTRPDILPPVFIQEFRKLQDKAPTIPLSDVQEQIETSLGRPAEELYASMDEEPLATASMAQVHRDTTDIIYRRNEPDEYRTGARIGEAPKYAPWLSSNDPDVSIDTSPLIAKISPITT